METIEKIISEYVRGFSLDLNSLDIYDSLRYKNMYEIQAAQIIAFTYKNDLKAVESLIPMLEESFIDSYPFGWNEKPYSPYDMDHGSYGAVTTAICSYSLIFALSINIRTSAKDKIINMLNKVFDSIYSLENNGYIRKNLINKSRVFNTDLIVALVTLKYIQILPLNSVRRYLFKEMSIRCVNRTLYHQMPNGAFRYHDLSISIPILYQAMCTSLLFSISDYIKHPYIFRSSMKGANFLLRNYDILEHRFDWEKSNCQDKAGSIWIYGWLPNILNRVGYNKVYNSLLKHLLQSQPKDGIFIPSNIDSRLDPKPDKFYSALLVSALSLTFCKNRTDKNKNFNFKIIFYEIIYFIIGAFNYIKCIIKQSIRKIFRKLIPVGALENDEW